MITIILSAGKSSRFGGNSKSMLLGPDGKRTVLEYQIDELEPDFLSLVFLGSQRKQVQDTIFKISQRKNQVTWLKLLWQVWLKETTGPLDSARQSVTALAGESEILISYNDVILPHDTILEFVSECRYGEYDAGICVFKSDNKRFQRDPSGEFCNSGLFYFSSGSLFTELAENAKAGDENGIPDLVYALENILYFDVTDKVIDIGIPEDYNKWIGK